MGLILPLEDQVTSLELSKKLKEFGIKQSSLFYWIIGGLCYRTECLPLLGEDWYSAFTASDVIKILPHRVNTRINYPFNIFRLIIKRNLICEKDIYDPRLVFNINYLCDSSYDGYFNKRLINNTIYDENLANCTAKVLIYLIENNLVSIEEINKSFEK